MLSERIKSWAVWALAIHQCNLSEDRSCCSQLAQKRTFIFYYSRSVLLIIYQYNICSCQIRIKKVCVGLFSTESFLDNFDITYRWGAVQLFNCRTCFCLHADDWLFWPRFSEIFTPHLDILWTGQASLPTRFNGCSCVTSRNQDRHACRGKVSLHPPHGHITQEILQTCTMRTDVVSNFPPSHMNRHPCHAHKAGLSVGFHSDIVSMQPIRPSL